MPVNIGEHTYGTITRRGDMNTLTIGKFCSIAEGVIFDGGFGHNTNWLSTYPFRSNLGLDVPHNATSKGDITIGNDVWIGEGAMVMSGVTIGNGAIIGARSVVTKNVYPYEIWAGNPAKFIRNRFSGSDYANICNLKWFDWPIENIKEAAPFLMSEDIEGLYNYYQTKIKT
jgi:virginiamycin A acetyltransferase